MKDKEKYSVLNVDGKFTKITSASTRQLSHLPKISIPLSDELISRLLQSEGIRSVCVNQKAGYESVVAYLPDAQILKISSNIVTGEQLDYDYLTEVLRPLKILQASEPFVGVFPAVKVTDKWEDISQEKFCSLVKSLYKKGFFLFDARPENLGTLKDGTLIVIDQGAVIDLKRRNEICAVSSKSSTYKEIFERRTGMRFEDIELFAELSIDYASAQAAHVKFSGLEYGKISGVISEGQLLKITKLFGSDSIIARTICERGLTQQETHDLIMMASELDNNLSWKDRVSIAAEQVAKRV